jgi:hypothetical protein
MGRVLLGYARVFDQTTNPQAVWSHVPDALVAYIDTLNAYTATAFFRAHACQ